MVPPGRVEDLAGEAAQAGQLRLRRFAERATGRDQEVGPVAAVGGVDEPAPAGLHPPRRVHLVPEPQMRAQTVQGHAPAQVGPDLRLGREAAGPVRVGGERQRVQVGRDVAGAARVAVVPPGAAHLVTPVEHQEVVVSPLFQPDRRADPAEAGADDGDPDALSALHPATSFLPAGDNPGSYHRVRMGGR